MKTTKYILILTLLFTLNLYGGSQKLIDKMGYETSYKKAIQIAKETNKPVMMMIGQERCPYCMKFEVKTLTKKSLHKVVKANFVPLTTLRYKDEGTYPKELMPKGVPTVLFIEPNTQEVFYKSFGHKRKSEFKMELEKAMEIFNKKY
jgi:thioredoxin-related protein